MWVIVSTKHQWGITAPFLLYLVNILNAYCQLDRQHLYLDMDYFIDLIRFRDKVRVCYSRGDMNTYAKGNARERELMQIMAKEGFLVDRKNRSKYNSNDFFTMFDIVGVKDNRCVFVQVKSNRGDYLHACKEIQKWMRKNALSIEAQVWYRENRKEWQGSKVTRYSRVNVSCF